MTFKGKRALVTGATKGIGRATVTELTRRGADVVALGRHLADLESLQTETGCTTLAVDLRDPAATREAVGRIEPVGLLVNCAGIVRLRPILDVTIDEFDDVMAVNVRSALLLAQHVARRLIAKQEGGAIVNVSSTASFLGQSGHTAYGTSKGALDALTRAMALELGQHGIRANAVNPTVTLTAMATEAWSDPEQAAPLLKRIPLGRFAEPEEVAQTIVFLLSDEASMVNGVTLRVDGGHLIT